MFLAVPFTVPAVMTLVRPTVSKDFARREVRTAVDAQWTRLAFAKKAKVDPGTLTDFLEGRRWPQGPTLAKIETALGWPAGRIVDMADGFGAGDGNGSVGRGGDDAPLFRYQRPPGLSDQEWDELRKQHADYWDWLVERAARER